MPHSVYTRNLGRPRSWRKATVRSLAQALLAHERITTTLARAKETQRLTERLITLGKSGTLSDRRRALSLLGEPRVVHRLFEELAPRFSARPGGYTRILHYRRRPGDGADLAVIELVELVKPVQKAVEPPRPKEAKPKEAKPKEAKPKETPKTPTEKPKPRGGFLRGLRRFFKGRKEP